MTPIDPIKLPAPAGSLVSARMSSGPASAIKNTAMHTAGHAAGTRSARARNYVLVHGAWHGAWCWQRVAQCLRFHGHYVYTPTFSGLAERACLLSFSLGLADFAQDLIDVIEGERLRDAILVAHSFGGLPALAMADRFPERIAQLVLLDAVVASHGESAFSLLAPEVVAARTQAALESSGGLTIPVPPPAAFGVSMPEQIALLESHCTPHPLKTFQDPLLLAGRGGRDIPTTYIQCVSPVYAPLHNSRLRARAQSTWAWDEIEAGHDAMICAPELLAEKLLRFA